MSMRQSQKPDDVINLPRPIILERPVYLALPTKYRLPTALEEEGRERVRNLNRNLILLYEDLAKKANNYGERNAFLEYNSNLQTSSEIEMAKTLHRGSKRLRDEAAVSAGALLSEIDAIGGQVYIPGELKHLVTLNKIVDTGTLSGLLESPPFFTENEELNGIPYLVNRLNFLIAIGEMDFAGYEVFYEFLWEKCSQVDMDDLPEDLRAAIRKIHEVEPPIYALREQARQSELREQQKKEQEEKKRRQDWLRKEELLLQEEKASRLRREHKSRQSDEIMQRRLEQYNLQYGEHMRQEREKEEERRQRLKKSIFADCSEDEDDDCSKDSDDFSPRSAYSNRASKDPVFATSQDEPKAPATSSATSGRDDSGLRRRQRGWDKDDVRANKWTGKKTTFEDD